MTDESIITECPLCHKIKGITLLKKIEKFSYHHCPDCDFIFIDQDILHDIDDGKLVFEHKHDYWEEELNSAKHRAWGSAIARMSECFHYCRIPINNFIDIGARSGFFLDAVTHFLPDSSNKFFGWEKFPPQKELQTTHENYLIADLSNINKKFQAGLCMEVIEHLTPKQVYSLLYDLRAKIDEGSFFIFNTGLVEYVLKEDSNYLDPVKRGHICIWSVKALNILLNDLGYTCYSVGQKTWAVGIEYKTKDEDLLDRNIINRIWSILPENAKILEDEHSGTVIKILGLESARAYAYDDELYLLGQRFKNDPTFASANQLTQNEMAKNTKRHDVINFIAEKINAQNYLEIGIGNPDNNFNLVRITNKYAVDPGVEFEINLADFKMTSDDFFVQLKENALDITNDIKFDIIFIDGLHLAYQVERDILNSFQVLSDNGLIVLHDCNPPTEY
ncbi:MAG: class I SAM-dependent methyltransferase, partial [Ginsengibacter sp.]